MVFHVHFGRVSNRPASDLMLFGPHGLAVARGGASSAKGPGFSTQSEDYPHCQSLPSPTLFLASRKKKKTGKDELTR